MSDLFAAPSETFYSTLENANTGLVGTIGVRVVNKTSGATTIARTTAGITEPVSGSGLYVATITAPAGEGHYAVIWDTGSVAPTTTAADDLVVSSDIVDGAPSIDVGAIVTAISATSALTVTVVTPVAQDGSITIVKGDDYHAADNRALEFVNADGDWPDLTSATVNLVVKHAQTGATELTKAGSVIVATGVNQTVRVALTAAETGAFNAGRNHVYDLVATLSSGRVASLQIGTLQVLGNPF